MYNYLKEYLIILYLHIKLKLTLFYYYCTNITTKISVIKNNKITSILYRYYFIYFINKIIYYLTKLRDYIDNQYSRIHHIQRVDGTHIYLIMDKNITISDFINFNSRRGDKYRDIALGDFIILDIYITYDNNNINIKNILNNYTESNSYGHHTLLNILDFNEIKYNNKSIIIIKGIKNGKQVIIKYKLCDIYDRHVNYIYGISSKKDEK